MNARKIAERFGGAAQLHRALVSFCGARGRKAPARETVYRWTMARPVGTGGHVPIGQIDLVCACARAEGIVLEAGDFVPDGALVS